ncbi:MAG: transcription-repair coupling factor [Lentisphaeria bacterium]|nr:transcription-repair coupling factor [Lentisphaeria bacterium]
MESTENGRKILKKWLEKAEFPGSCIGSVDETAAPLLVLAVRQSRPEKPLLLEVPGAALGEKILLEMRQWAACLDLPADIVLFPDGTSSGRKLLESEIPRAQALDRVLHQPPDILIVSASAELSPAPDPERMRHSELVIRPGMTLSPEKLAEILTRMDYDDEPEVVQKGEFARRGGLMDVFSPAEKSPVRIEFFGDEVESLRLFSETTQLSVGRTEEYKIIMRSGAGEAQGNDSDLTDYIQLYSPRIVTLFPAECEGALKRFGSEELARRWRELRGEKLWKEALLLLDEVESAAVPEDRKRISPVFPSARHILRMIPDGTEENIADLVRQISSNLIRQLSDEHYRILIAGGTDGDLSPLHQWLEEEGLTGLAGVECAAMAIPRGVLLPGEKLALFSEYELYSSPRRLAAGRKPVETGPENDFRKLDFRDAVDETISSDLEEGDHAVHVNYGICIYRGMKIVEEKQAEREMIELEFDDERTVLVPISQAHFISRYIGSRKGAVKLSKLGSTRWERIKSDAAESVRTLALDMLRMHAIRCKADGTAFPADDLAQHLFEKSFPFTETPDQLRAAEEIKKDMESPRPMDRLLCGDVGYGKTEVAMRAVFKCVMAGKQAAVLVPTTVLAQQHYYNFLERFAEYPVIIETLSRFRTKGQQREVIERLKAGTVDVVIGTHRLLQQDVSFHNLGLVVVDEEQRFGVLHKEKLKNLRTTVDVLTMTATPIPRTLYFSMSGMRDLSTILSAPVQRLPVQTVVSQYDEQLIRGAVSRELQRGGQVYYLHNRVQTIQDAAVKLQTMFPEARIAVGHGQMDEAELEDVMSAFIEGKTDILVCTTIIESGLDIPNANTILIERADRFGLAELYQLRGRVGRWRRQAYAYLLLPPHGILSGDVRKRISAMRQYTHLGAGFKLALRDLEIRGAGNILGAEQSGHINAIGFSLYCDLLRTVTSQLKGEETTLKRECRVFLDFVEYAIRAPQGKAAAAFPPDYINSDRLRIDAYRRLASVRGVTELEQLQSEIIDRFGRLPVQAENLFLLNRIRVIGISARLGSVTCSDGRILMSRGQELIKIDGKIPRLPAMGTPEDKLRILKGMLEKFFLKNQI